MKTIVELFDEQQIKNVIAGLGFSPEKIIFVGFKEVMTKKRMSDLKHFFSLRGEDTELEFEIVGRYDYSDITRKLSSIVESNEDCNFDVTGGKELVLLGMGEIAAKYNVPMFQFNIRTGSFIPLKNCEGIEEPPGISMLISECVALNGGEIIHGGDEYRWALTDDFRKDIKNMWGICKRNCAEWNRQSAVLGTLEKFRNEDLFVEFNVEDIKAGLEEERFNLLYKYGLIRDYKNDGKTVSFRYKNHQVHSSLVKAGNALELYTYMAAKEITEDAPGFYDDIDIGVMVDWDGVVYPSYENKTETRNEIDVILMRDMTPVFISCKNGEVHKEALYELNTVAEKFGGENAKKVLVTTYVSASLSNRKHLMQRARDMKIEMIEGVDKIDYKEFLNEMKKRVK